MHITKLNKIFSIIQIQRLRWIIVSFISLSTTPLLLLLPFLIGLRKVGISLLLPGHVHIPLTPGPPIAVLQGSLFTLRMVAASIHVACRAGSIVTTQKW